MNFNSYRPSLKKTVRIIQHKTILMHEVFYMHLVMSGAVGIEPTAPQLRAQQLSVELTASAQFVQLAS